MNLFLRTFISNPTQTYLLTVLKGLIVCKKVLTECKT